MKVTKTHLEARLQRINTAMQTDMMLDFASYYGGYCLTNNSGSHAYTMRMPAKEMRALLNGMQLTLDLQNATAVPM